LDGDRYDVALTPVKWATIQMRSSCRVGEGRQFDSAPTHMSWKGWIIEEGLKDPGILSELRVDRSCIEENMQTGEARIWNVHTVSVEDDDMDGICAQLENIIKPGFYAHFTNYESLLIMIFHGMSFRIRIRKVLLENEIGALEFKADPRDLQIWKDAVEYAASIGKVDPRYLVKVE